MGSDSSVQRELRRSERCRFRRPRPASCCTSGGPGCSPRLTPSRSKSRLTTVLRSALPPNTLSSPLPRRSGLRERKCPFCYRCSMLGSLALYLFLNSSSPRNHGRLHHRNPPRSVFELHTETAPSLAGREPESTVISLRGCVQTPHWLHGPFLPGAEPPAKFPLLL